MENALTTLNIGGIDCYEKDGVAYLKLEAVARGLGFTEIAASGNECVRWRTVRKYLADLGVATSCDGDKLPDFIPENIFYRLAMKAKNETAEKFQAFVADEVIPQIRKTGSYFTTPKDYLSALKALVVAEEQRQALEAENRVMRPKADYFDALVDRNTLTGIRDTGKEFHMKQGEFVKWLLDMGFVYRAQDGKGTLKPYGEHVKNGLFELKECKSVKNQWSGTQLMVTPKGRETFRLLLRKEA